MNQDNTLRAAINTFFRQKKTILLVTILFTLAAVFIAYFKSPQYKITASILLEGGRVVKSAEGLEQTPAHVKGVRSQDILSEIEMFLSQPVMQRTASKLIAMGLGIKGDNAPEMAEELSLIIAANMVPGTNIFEATLYSSDPQWGAKALEVLIGQYLIYRASIYRPKEAQPFFNSQTTNYDQAIQKAENKLLGLTKEAGTPDPALEIGNNLKTKLLIEQQLIKMGDRKLDLNSRIRHIKESLRIKDVHFFSSVQNSAITDLAKRLQDLTIERGKLRRVFTDKTAKVQRLTQQIEDTSQALRREVELFLDDLQSELKALQAKMSSARKRLKRLTVRNQDLYQYGMKVDRIKRELALLKSTYNTFYLRREEARISTGDQGRANFDVQVLRRPLAPSEPYFPIKNEVIGSGMLVGFFLGCILGFIREYFDQTIKGPQDVVQHLKNQVIFSIPQQ